MTTANCPSCGAPIEFAIGSSIVVICKFCHALVARTDRGVEDYGKVAALVDTGSPLRTGITGKYRGHGFRLTGRSQMKHQAGGVWDEWYAAFDDGRWGWVAEAAGKFYITFRTAEEHVPEIGELKLGSPVPQMGNFVVAEIGTAVLNSAEGELPWRPEPGETYRYADLSGPDLRFATLDYSEEKPIVYKGTEATLDDLGIEAGARARETRAAVGKLSCSNCGAPLELRAPDQAQRIFCPHCGAAHDVTQGNLRYIGVTAAKRVTPAIPLGKTGTIDGVPYAVAGFMERSVTFDQKYFWNEYLLFNQHNGFRWLVQDENHWSFVAAIAVGDVAEGNRNAIWKGKTFRLFQVADATVESVLGEFYWKVAVGERVATADYIHPPEGLSKETTTEGAQEVNWSYARYAPPEEIEKAFGVKLARPATVGSMQPPLATNTARLWATFVVLLVLLASAVAITRANRVVYDARVTIPAPADWTSTTTKRPVSATAFSPEFNLDSGQNVQISAYAPVNNTWAYVGGDLLNVDTGVAEGFELPVEFYSGSDSDGSSWSEGGQHKSVYISAPGKGRYTVRMEVQWENASAPPVDVVVREGVFRWTHLFVALVAITIPTLFGHLRARAFEMQRWKDSDFSPYGS